MNGAPKLDRIDIRILSHLQRSGRASNVDLADAVGLSPSPCLTRVAECAGDALDQLLGDGALHDQVRTSHAYLAGIGGDRLRHHARHRVRVGHVGKDDLRALAPRARASPELLPGCVTEEQLAPYHAALTSYLVTLACSDRDVARGVVQRVLSDRDREMGLALLDASCPPIVELAEDIKGAGSENGK